MGFWNLHVLLCNFSTAFSASFCGHPKDSAAEMVDVLFFPSSVMHLLWAPSHCLRPSVLQSRHWAHQCWGTPGKPLAALSLAFIIVTKLTPVPLQWQLWYKGERSAIWCHLLGQSLPQVIPTLSSLHPWKKQDGFSSLLPAPRPPPPDVYATVSFMIVISPWVCFFFSDDISIIEIGRFQSAL